MLGQFTLALMRVKASPWNDEVVSRKEPGETGAKKRHRQENIGRAVKSEQLLQIMQPPHHSFGID